MADLLFTVGKPRALFIDNVVFDRRVQQAARGGHSLTEHDLHLDLSKRRGHLVLHHLDPNPVPDGVGVFGRLDGLDLPHLQPDRSVEFQRVPPGGGLRVAVHHADFHPGLVDEDQHRSGFADSGGELAQRLAHQPGLEPHVGVPHIPLNLRLGSQGRHGIHHDHIHRAGPDQAFGDFQGLLPAVGLRNPEVVDIHPEILRVHRVQRVFRVHKRRDASQLLGLRDGVQGQGGLP